MKESLLNSQQRYFRVDELGELNENQREGLMKLHPVIELIRYKIGNSRLILRSTENRDIPAEIRYDRNCTTANLCFNGFVEGLTEEVGSRISFRNDLPSGFIIDGKHADSIFALTDMLERRITEEKSVKPLLSMESKL